MADKVFNNPNAARPSNPLHILKHPGLGKLSLLALTLVFSVAACSSSGNTLNAAYSFPFILYQGQNDLGGSNLDLSDLRGKPVVLNFWAGLCPPCRAEMPDFQLFYEDFKEDVTLVSIDVGQYMGLGNHDDARELLDQLGVTYPAGFTDDDRVIRLYEVIGMPTTVFINSKGDIFRKWSGLLNLEILSDVTNEMLAQETG
jgi:thiol-disulfide isomerase/thioredoxin